MGLPLMLWIAFSKPGTYPVMQEINQHLKQETLELCTMTQKQSHILALRYGVSLLSFFVFKKFKDTGNLKILRSDIQFQKL